MKTLPFKLEAAKAGHPLVTRDGRKAKFIAYVPELPASLATIVRIDNEEFPWFYHANGQAVPVPSEKDLFLLDTSELCYRPWTLNEVPLEHWLRVKGLDGADRITGVFTNGVIINAQPIWWDALLSTYEHSADPLNGPWLPCGVKE
jgi:hypothetical protein